MLSNCLMLTFGGIQIFNFYQIHHRNMMIIHSFRNESAWQFIKNDSAWLCTSNTLLNNEDTRKYFEKFWQKNGIAQIFTLNISEMLRTDDSVSFTQFKYHNNAITFGKHTFHIVTSSPNNYKADFNLVFGKPFIPKRYFQNSDLNLIADNSSDNYHINIWKMLSEKNHCKFTSVKNSKALCINF